MKNYLTGVLLASASAFAESTNNQTAAEKEITLEPTAYVKSLLAKEDSEMNEGIHSQIEGSVKAAETYDAPTGKQVVTDAIDYSKGVAEAKQDNK